MGKRVEMAAQVRVADGVKDFFISKGVMRALGSIKADFPSVTAVGASETGGSDSNATPTPDVPS